MSVSLQEINFLIWRYFLENGFPHTAFLFAAEALADQVVPRDLELPPGLLQDLLQRSLECMNMESAIIAARRDPSSPAGRRIVALEGQFPDTDESTAVPAAQVSRCTAIRLSPAVGTVLTTHLSPVWACRWLTDYLATVSGDPCVIIWKLDAGIPVTETRIVLPADPNLPEPKIACIDWSSSGLYLACGSLDYTVRVYSSSGLIQATLVGHSGHVHVVKFNHAGDFLVSGSADHTVILWKLATFQKLHTYAIHSNAIIDITWRSDQVFTTASADNCIGICHIDGSYTVQAGHTGSVNVVAWNSRGTILASGSSDGTVRLWGGTAMDAVLDHKSPVTTLQWVNDLVFIAGSADGMLRVWHAQTKRNLNSISIHSGPLYAMDLSPNKQFVASGSADETVAVVRWNDGVVVARFLGNSPVYDVNWDSTGRFLAVAFDDSSVIIIPFFRYAT
jgi:transducin (beta)-like 1